LRRVIERDAAMGLRSLMALKTCAMSWSAQRNGRRSVLAPARRCSQHAQTRYQQGDACLGTGGLTLHGGTTILTGDATHTAGLAAVVVARQRRS
jgi:hypothetical protein